MVSLKYILLELTRLSELGKHTDTERLMLAAIVRGRHESGDSL